MNLAPYKTHWKGAQTEYAVAAWFLGQGHQVLWPSIQQGAYDFAIEHAGRFQRVQVKTGSRSHSGLRATLDRNEKGGKHSDWFDYLAILGPRGHIWMIPAQVLTVGKAIVYEPGTRKQRKRGRGLDSDLYLIHNPTSSNSE